MQVSRSTIASLLLIFLMLKNVCAFSQTLPPPSSGSGPLTGSDNTKILLPVAGGLVVGAVVYYLIKKKPKNIPVNIRIEDYLWDHNILPTADALKITYSINPSVKETGLIGSKQKLILPDLPELPDLRPQVESSSELLPVLNEQFVLLKSNLISYRKKYASNVKMSKLNTYLNDAEKEIAGYRQNEREMNPERTQLVINLVSVLNQTLKGATRAGNIKAAEANLMENIYQNLHEILEPPIIKKESSGGKSMGFLNPVLNQVETFYASMNAINPDINSGIVRNKEYSVPKKRNQRLTGDISKYFAIAICKTNQDGTPVTKGAAVEKKYTVRYVCPALKEFESSYSVCTGKASWVVEKLYPSKYYFEVFAGKNKVSLQNPLIDVVKYYNNKPPGKPNEAIRILIDVYE